MEITNELKQRIAEAIAADPGELSQRQPPCDGSGYFSERVQLHQKRKL